MPKIIPTITAMTPSEYADQWQTLSQFAERIHIDITDGEFAPSHTVNLNQIYWDRGEIVQQIDLHLMMRRPIDWLDQIVSLAPDLAIFHVESDDASVNLPRIFEHLRKFNIRVGVALLPETAPEQAADVIKLADQVLVFGGHLGYQGGTADLGQLEKVASIRELNPGAEIAWDGGANSNTVAQIAMAGVDIINVGSAVMESTDPAAAYQNLEHAISQS